MSPESKLVFFRLKEAFKFGVAGTLLCLAFGLYSLTNNQVALTVTAAFLDAATVGYLTGITLAMRYLKKIGQISEAVMQ